MDRVQEKLNNILVLSRLLQSEVSNIQTAVRLSSDQEDTVQGLLIQLTLIEIVTEELMK